MQNVGKAVARKGNCDKAEKPYIKILKAITPSPISRSGPFTKTNRDSYSPKEFKHNKLFNHIAFRPSKEDIWVSSQGKPSTVKAAAK